ncbi:MAG: TM2 domain-containing protein [Myxococcales bacterium]|nr:TM2 domain-containing protein [Myxococcales bacterium]
MALNNQGVGGAQLGATSDKQWLVALLLCFFLGPLGVHRFYTGHTVLGVVQLLTLGCCGIWSLVDFILILTGSLKDANGLPLKK